MSKFKFAYLLLLRVIPIGAQAVFFAMLLSQNGASFTGVIVFFLAGYSVLRGVAPLGLDLEVLRVSSRLANSSGTLNRAFLATALKLSFFFGSIVTLVLSSLTLVVSTPQNALLGVAVSALPSCLVSVLIAFLRPSRFVLRSQAIDAFGTALLPNLICALLLNLGVLTLFNAVAVFTLCCAATLIPLVWLAVKQSQKSLPQESIDKKTLKENGIAQVLLAVNSRFPTLITGFMSTATVVAYVDLGSKIQLIGATVAWLFGVFQSPLYAKDGDIGLSNASRSLVRRSYVWSACVTLSCALGLLVFSPYLAGFLGVGLWNFIIVVIIFTLIALAEAPVNSFGYAFAMTKDSRLISLSIVLQLGIVSCGVKIAGENLLEVCLAVLSGTLARLFFVLVMVRRSRNIV